jgi:serine/threonine protein kinase
LPTQKKKKKKKKKKVVGEGISGVVWKAKWNDQLVAVKKFDENSLSFNEEEFRSEVALMSVLRHENVVHCIGSSMQEENLFILLELFNRGSVSTVAHDLSIPLPIQRAVSLALDAAKGFVLEKKKMKK